MDGLHAVARAAGDPRRAGRGLGGGPGASVARRWRVETVASAVVAGCGLVGLLAAGNDIESLFGALLTAGGLGMGGYALLRLRQVLDVRTMLGTGPWQRAEARTVSTRKRQNGRVDATVDLLLVTGERWTATLSYVETDLPANIYKAESVWIVGHPRPRRRSVIGFPGYPVLAPAVLTPNHEEW